jgi:hypothetical protein
MSNLSSRKVISLAILFSFIIVQFAMFSPLASAQGRAAELELPWRALQTDQSFRAPHFHHAAAVFYDE